MIIWGWRGREIEQSRGDFFCPQCNCEQDFQYMRVATYFTLYFIPLFETQHHGDYVRCFGCQGQFQPAVLDYEPVSDSQRLLLSLQADLDSGMPLEMLRTKLRNAGMEGDAVDNLTLAAAGDGLHSCAACRLTFVNSIERCTSCGASLQTARA